MGAMSFTTPPAEQLKDQVQHSARDAAANLEKVSRHIAKLAGWYLENDDADEAYAWLKTREDVTTLHRGLQALMRDRELPLD